MSKHHSSFFISFTLIFLILVSCAQHTPTPTVTSAPISTATPSAPLVILLAPPDSNPDLLAIAAELTVSYASSNDLQFEQRSLLNPAELPASLVKLVVLAPDPGTEALAAAAPAAQVVTIGFSVEGGPANIVSISAGGGSDGAQIAFIAGYVAAMSAGDWRTGILYSGNSTAVVNDFSAGAAYFCGSCAPVDPPNIEYPVAAQATDAQNWQTAADQLLAQVVNVVYLSPEMETSAAAQYLAGSGVLLIGNGTPPADVADLWIASVSSDSSGALRELLPLALSGQPIVNAGSLSLMNLNTNLFSQSRQDNVDRVIDDLLAGFIQLPAD